VAALEGLGGLGDKGAPLVEQITALLGKPRGDKTSVLLPASEDKVSKPAPCRPLIAAVRPLRVPGACIVCECRTTGGRRMPW
jgi:hypothetical protein